MVSESRTQSEEFKALEYVLADFLELKAGLGSKETRPFKEFLFKLPLNGRRVSGIEGFLVAEHLVVFEKRNPEKVKHLIFLSPEDGTFRVRPLQKPWGV